MKRLKSLFFMFLSVAIFSSCNVDQADTEFNVVRKSQEADDGLLDIADNEDVSFCAQFNDDGDEICDDYEECQPMFDDNQIFLACIEKEPEVPEVIEPPAPPAPNPYPEEDPVVNYPQVEQPQDPVVTYPPVEEPEDEDKKNCDKKKPGESECKGKNQIVICHIPPGNPEAAHSICISQRGWENGHKDSHGNDESQDYLGACTSETLDPNLSVDE